MRLAFDRVGEGPKRLVMLHGIFGRGRNWGSIARALAGSATGWTIDLVDLRLHGASRGFAPPHDVEACARDVTALGPMDALLGHSFGGKVALLAASLAGVRRTWVIDSDPGARAPTGESWRMLEVLRAHPGPFAKRDDAVAAVLAAGYDARVATWMATNVEPGAGGYTWIFDPDALEALLRDYFARDLWSLVGGSTRLVRGTRSPVLDDAKVERARAAGAIVHELDATHWVHVEAAASLTALVAADLAV